jgi:hypothetical protein
VLAPHGETTHPRAQPAGAPPLDATSRLEILNEAPAAGRIADRPGQANSGIIEYEKAQAEDTAIVEMLERHVDGILYDDEDAVLPGFLPPPYLELAVKKSVAAYLKARNDMSEELRKGSDDRKRELRARLAMLETYITNAAKALHDKLAPPAPPPPVGGPLLPPMGGMPGGGPMDPIPPQGPVGPPPGDVGLPPMDEGPPMAGGNVTPIR